jgi:anti-sigma factor RsiW
MAECSEISLLLGAFEDAELEPHEMQEVAYHLARCDSCTGELADFASIGRELRSNVELPSLVGFAQSVQKRIENLPVPLGLRVRRFFGRLGEQASSGLAMGTAMAAVAALTVLVLTPYLRRALSPSLGQELAKAPAVASQQLASVARNVEAAPEAIEKAADSGDIASDSHAVISKLEAEMPSVAVWTEPHSDTTVIWLPDQQ